VLKSEIRVVVIVIGVLLAGAWAAATADAHAALVRSDPAAGASLDTPPTEIRIWFAEPLEASYTGAQLLDATGTPVPGATAAIAPDDTQELVLTPPPDLPDGPYTVAWRTLSAADGHTLAGYFGFRVGTGTASGFVPTADPEGNETVRSLTRGLALLGLAAVLALAPVTLGVFDPTVHAVPAIGAPLLGMLRRYAVLAAVLAMLTSVAALAAQAVAISPGASILPATAQTLTQTRYGQLWLLRWLLLLLGIGTVFAALWSRPSRRRPLLVLAAVVALALPLPFSLLSHAAAEPEGRGAAIAADALHLLGAAVWGGGLLLLVAVFLPALRPLAREQRRAALLVAVPRFSIIGVATWAILMLTGLYAAWLEVGTLGALRETAYGQTLLLKGALLLPTLALAAVHFVLGWRGSTSGDPARIGRTLSAEALLIVAVFLVVGRLIGQEPAREVLASQHPPQLVIPLAFDADDGTRQGHLAIAPGAAGVNTFTLEVDGAPLPEGSEGVLRFALPAQDMGEQELTLPQEGPSRFNAEGAELALAGDWALEVLVRKIGAFSWETHVPVRIATTPPPPPDLNPAPLFGPGGIVGMIALVIGLTGLTAAALTRGALPQWRVSVAAVGVVVLAAGAVLLAGSRLPVEGSAPALAQLATPETPASAAASPAPMTEHDHDQMMVMHGAATPAAFPGIATPVRQGGLIVTVSAEPTGPGPTDITVEVSDADGTPLEDARVVVFAAMAGMSEADTGIPADEAMPGRYVAKEVPLSMAGDWKLSVRISPKGQATQIVPIVLTVS
jgi:copper transport protein